MHVGPWIVGHPEASEFELFLALNKYIIAVGCSNHTSIHKSETILSTVGGTGGSDAMDLQRVFLQKTLTKNLWTDY